MWFVNLGISYALAGQCEEAIAAFEEAIRRARNNLIAHALATQAYGMCGREEEARAMATEVLRINPKFSVKKFANSVPYKNQADKERTFEAMRNAGLK
jgi:adenylate cyclase